MVVADGRPKDNERRLSEIGLIRIDAMLQLGPGDQHGMGVEGEHIALSLV